MTNDTPLTPPAADNPLVAGAKRLAARLSVSKRTIDKMNSAGELPRPIRLRGRVVWRLAEIEGWLAAGAPKRDQWDAVKSKLGWV